ncbi:carbon monoxide dehydrogenase subunit G [uncultured Shimia sp.]|uniref:CoxG family protein n=1 Tax=uncultured Shimia sp. TaxID=573152 RepID=UPI00262F1DE3|nr:carbon monoxide dehydrogenase subunit G [uncultured Shimia sp.]
MHMSDQREIAAPVSEVWNALLSADTLLACVPGAKELTGSVDDGFDAVVVQKVGPVKATFKGHVSLSDLVEHQSLTLSGEGKGGAAGFAKGEADVKLTETEAGTLLEYDVDAKVGGKLAQLGSRLIDGFAKKMADQFFSNLQEALEGPSDGAEGEDSAAQDDAAEANEKKGWIKKLTGG